MTQITKKGKTVLEEADLNNLDWADIEIIEIGFL